MLHFRVFDLRSNVFALAEIHKFIQRHRVLIYEMTRREVRDRYAGQVLGVAWAIAVPLLTMGVYVFAFTVLFKGRLGPSDGGLGFAAYALAAMGPWLVAQDAFTRAIPSVTANANLVKQIVFPTEVLPLKVVLGTVPMLVINLTVTIILAAFAKTTTIFGLAVLLPLCTLILVVFCAGLSYALAALGVFLRDIKDVVGVLLSIGFFLHPIIYPPTGVPAWLEKVFVSSPLSHIMWCFRDALIWGEITKPLSWYISAGTALVFLMLGWRMFRMLRPSFGNAL